MIVVFIFIYSTLRLLVHSPLLHVLCYYKEMFGGFFKVEIDKQNVQQNKKGY